MSALSDRVRNERRIYTPRKDVLALCDEIGRLEKTVGELIEKAYPMTYIDNRKRFTVPTQGGEDEVITSSPQKD